MYSNNRKNSLLGDNVTGTQVLSIVTIALDRDTEKLLKLWLPSASVRELADYPGDESFIDEMKVLGTDVCLIDFDKTPSKAFTLAEHIHRENADVAVFVVSSDARPDAIIQAMRTGCREYLFKPLARDQLLEAIIRAGSRRREKKDRASAQILTFIGAKGGCGVTTLATQLGAMLASANSKKTLLLDLHPGPGEAALYLGFTSTRYHSYELMDNTDRLDPELLHNVTLHHSSGLDIVPAPNNIETTRHAASSIIAATFNVLRPWYDYILVDVPSTLNDQTVNIIGHSDYLYIVTIPEVSALRNVSHLIDYTAQEEIPQDRVRVIVNRFDKRGPIPESQIEKVIRRKIFWSVPNQYHQALRTITNGDSGPNGSRDELIRNMKDWAATIGRAKVETGVKPAKKKRGILGLFGEGS